MKLYTEEQVLEIIANINRDVNVSSQELLEGIEVDHIELPSDEEIEEKLNVAYGNGYEQGEMDFYKKMRGKEMSYADGYAEGYKRALELIKWTIEQDLTQRV